MKKGIYDKFGEEGLKGGIPLEFASDNPWSVGYVFHNNPEKVFREFFGGDNPFAEFFAEDGSEVLLPFGGPRGRGALRRDPPIVRDLYVSLEDLFHGCTKKIKISRRVMNEDGQTSTIKDKILTIDVQKNRQQPPLCCHHPPVKGNGPSEGTELHLWALGLQQQLLVPLHAWQALTGCTLDVWTLDGRLLNIPINDIVDPKYYKMVPGEGMPLAQDPQRKGDLYIYFDILFPKRLSPEVKTLLRSILHP
ncbi:hypothetical protein IHE44_0006003 [Lamprotornis superbus]|uniref:DnaJ subfamily B member 13 n=1 Tax=Lamprotornis superbus TaxID=245042 RepID=A0A835NGM4_9PASS|nr:hypothetical protein IHE44_0006003 [Lamprotornis superbus]